MLAEERGWRLDLGVRRPDVALLYRRFVVVGFLKMVAAGFEERFKQGRYWV
jgi:hypothetical protein